MRNFIAMFFWGMLMSGTAVAQDITLYEYSSRTLDIVEAIAACSDQERACTGEDIEALKEDIANNRREFMGGIKSGALPGLLLTLEEGENLQARTKELQGRFAHIALFDGQCNRGALLASSVLRFINSVLSSWPDVMKSIFLSPTPYLFNVVAAALYTIVLAFVVLAATAFGLLSLPALSACLFWWL
ncbi:MAG: hypothetical protein JW832_11575 [Deltaproteobacteria bacterium]|nr:hypothetical protein [Deltaproteobacteria bacterium]